MRAGVRRTRPSAVAILALLATITVVTDISPVVSESPAQAATAPAVPPSIPTTGREPVVAPNEGNWIVDPPEVSIAVPDGDVAAGDLRDAGYTRLAGDGGPEFDVFAAPGGSEHVALVYPGVTNELRPNGTWRPIDRDLISEPHVGYRAVTAGTSMLFPEDLSLATPITTQFAGGTISVVPFAPEQATASASGDTVTYDSVAPGVDATYTVGVGGYKEVLTLREALMEPIVWTVTAPGFEARVEPTGELAFLRAGSVAAVMPIATLMDSSTPPRSTIGAYSVLRTGPTSFHVGLTIDPAYLEQATYPVIIDPGTQTMFAAANDDTYVDSANPGTDFRSSWLPVTNDAAAVKRAYVRHNTAPFTRNERIVYAADYMMYITNVLGGRPQIDVRRVLSAWPSPLTWNSQPSVDTTTLDSNGCQPTGGCAGWLSFDLAAMYQHILQSDIATPWVDNGVQASTTGPGGYEFRSGESAAGPALALVWNDLPAAPTLDVPANGITLENDSPTLKILGGSSWPSDPNGDEVLVQFQVSDSQTDWTNPHVKWESGWTDERSAVVPTGILVDGTTYYWRTRSWDVCSTTYDEDATVGMCKLTDGLGVKREQNTSSVRSFLVSMKHFGDDPRYAMWSHEAGNGLTIKVNEANGNLFLDLPLDALATPIGDLGIALSYNSEQNADFGITPGWSLDIGPSSNTRDLPLELVKLSPFPDAGIKIRLGGGRALFFPHREGKVFASVGPLSGVVKQNADGSFLYTAADGGQYQFNVNGKLLRADPVASAAAWGDFGFAYAYNAQGELQTVTDPLGRAVTINWISNRPDTITAWTGEVWTLSYTGGHLSAVQVLVTNPAPTPATTVTERIGFTYDAQGTVSEIDNGVTSNAARTGWTVTYLTDPKGLRRVSTVKAPPGLAPTAPTPWTFQYSGPYMGTTATYACVTDPLGSPGVACTAGHQTRVDFNSAGLPIGITGPMDQTSYFPVTTLIWDSNNNLVCGRTPAANAALLIQWDPLDPTQCQLDSRSTKYTYRSQEPFQLLIERRPVGNSSGSGSREVISYDYDRDQAGTQFNGLWAEEFANKNLHGIPRDSVVWRNPVDMDENWGTGSPGNLPVDNFSIRWSGLLDVENFPDQGRRVGFRITTADEGVSLAVGNSVLLDCLGTTQPTGTYNCGTSQVVYKRLFPGLRSLVLEYADAAGSAALKVEWDQGSGVWQVLPLSDLQTNLGLITKQTISSGETTRILETKYIYATDWELSRQLPTEIAAKDLGNVTDVRRTTLTYGQYGQVLTTTTATGTPFAATTTNDYTFNATTSCLTKVTDPTGAVTNLLCNAAGDTTQVTEKVRAIGLQAQQDRITTTTYDDLGRVVKVLYPSSASVQMSYDLAGRPVSIVRDLGSGAGHDPTATTAYTYDDAGHLLTETLPRVLNPATGLLAPPVVTHNWNWLDTETAMTDVRGKTWSYAYDAIGRLISTTSPSTLLTETEYRLVSAATYDQRVTTWSPPGQSTGVPTVSKLDVNGRVTAEQVGSLTSTSNTYDPLGRLTASTDPAGVKTTYIYNGFGQTKTMTEFATSTTPATTTYAYDVSGRLDSVDGPRPSPAIDVTSYDYDLAGRLTSAKQEGITLPGGSAAGVSTTYLYDDAAELVRVSQPLTSSLTQVRDWTFDTTGRMASAVDARGTTTYTYGAGDQLEQVGDPRGITLRFEYDNFGRQTRRYRSAPSTADDQTFTYDPAGNLLTAKVVSTNTTITMEYDNDARISKVYQASATPTTTYAYNGTTGRLTSIVDPAGTTAFPVYDANGLLKEIDDPFSTTNVIYTYDTAGRPTRRTDGSGLCWKQDYESGTGRIDKRTIYASTSCTGTYRARFDLGYDLASNVTSRIEYVSGNTSTSDTTPYAYTFDGGNRLLSATGPSSFSRTYAWDGGGNRTSLQVGTSTPVTTTYDAAGLPTTSSDATTFTHDQIGDLTAVDRTGTTNDRYFTYGSWSQLTKTAKTANGSDVVYALDALDRVLSRTEGSTVAGYSYQGVGETLAKTVVGATTTLYANSPAGPLMQRQGTTDRYYVRDVHGDVVAWSGASAAVMGTAAYDPFGLVLASTGEMGTIAPQGSLRFQSDLTDVTTGQVDIGARLYEPTLGRFSSKDPMFGDLASPMTLNPYLYGMASPVTFDDPTGYCANPNYCPVQIGGTTEMHSEEWEDLGSIHQDAWNDAAGPDGSGGFSMPAIAMPRIRITVPAQRIYLGPVQFSLSATYVGPPTGSGFSLTFMEGGVAATFGNVMVSDDSLFARALGGRTGTFPFQGRAGIGASAVAPNGVTEVSATLKSQSLWQRVVNETTLQVTATSRVTVGAGEVHLNLAAEFHRQGFPLAPVAVPVGYFVYRALRMAACGFPQTQPACGA